MSTFRGPPSATDSQPNPLPVLPQGWSSNFPRPDGPPPACRDCKHFARLSDEGGECRYNPPTSRAAERWPWVAAGDFCGRFEARGAPAVTGGLSRITEG